MNEQELQAILEQVVKLLQEGQDPNAIMQQLVEGGLDQATAQQIIEAAMQQAGGAGGADGQAAAAAQTPADPNAQDQPQQPQQTGGSTNPDQGGSVIEQALSTIGPAALLSLLDEWDNVSQEQKTQIKAQLQDMASSGSEAGQEAPPAAQGNAVEAATFGQY